MATSSLSFNAITCVHKATANITTTITNSFTRVFSFINGGTLLD